MKWNLHLFCMCTSTHWCCSNPSVGSKKIKIRKDNCCCSRSCTAQRPRVAHTWHWKKWHKMLWWSHPQEMLFSEQCLSQKLVTQTPLYPCKSICGSSTGTPLQEDNQPNALQPVLGWENECEFSQETSEFLCMSYFYCTWDRPWLVKN